MNTEQAANRLANLCNTIPGLLQTVREQEFVTKPSPDKWSKKEILGHLIDSAANNHQRFVRVQFEEAPAIFYDQNNWVKYNHYNELDPIALIELWSVYNKHLTEVIRRIPVESLSRKCTMRDGNQVTLAFLIEDYVHHMEHHLRQIISYE